MKLKIPFYKIKIAIENASNEKHYFIDKKNHKIIFISEFDENYKEKLRKIKKSDVIGIKPRMSDEDYRIMRSFVFENKKSQTLNITKSNNIITNGNKQLTN